MRKILLLVVVAIAGGCGESEKSFLELDAIYKEESAILDRMRKEYADERLKLKREYQGKINNRWKAVVQTWEREHYYEFTPKEEAARKVELEKSFTKSLTPSESAEMAARRKKLDDRLEPLIKSQTKKVERIKTKRDAAKEVH